MPSGFNFWLKLALVLSIILVLAFGSFLIWSTLHTANQKIGTAPVNTTGSIPTGQIVISYDRKVGDGQTTQLVPLVYDFLGDTLVYEEVDKLTSIDPYAGIVYHHSFSNDGRYAVFTVASTAESDSSAEATLSELPHQIYLADFTETVNPAERVRFLQEAEAVTVGRNNVKQLPVVSDKGDILYMSHSFGPSEDVFVNSLPEEWEIHLLTNDGIDRLMINGAHPKWIDTDQFVYLKSDGIYLHSVSNGTNLLLKALSNSTIEYSIDVSNDGHFLVWSDLANGGVTLFELTEEEDQFHLVPKAKIIETTAVSVIFSPDSKWLAIQVPISNENNDSNLSTGLAIYDIDSNKMYRPQSIVFSDANIAMTRLTDWINR